MLRINNIKMREQLSNKINNKTDLPEVARIDSWAVVVRRHALPAPVGTRGSRSWRGLCAKLRARNNDIIDNDKITNNNTYMKNKQ